MGSNSNNVKKWRDDFKDRIIKSFGGGCGICGYNKCSAALELHHLDPRKKDFTIGSFRANPKNWDIVVNELRKCVLLCSICHREYHHGLIEDISKVNRFNESFTHYKEDVKLSKVDKCPVCGENKNHKMKSCSSVCRAFLREKINWPDNDKLGFMVWEKPTVIVAKELGVSDKAVEKRLKKFNIQKPPRGYWTKMKYIEMVR